MGSPGWDCKVLRCGLIDRLPACVAPAAAPAARPPSSRPPEPILAVCDVAASEALFVAGLERRGGRSRIRCSERPRYVLQVHYHVECCLVQRMDRSETVRALQAVGVTPCFTELGAAVQPPLQHQQLLHRNRRLSCFAGVQVPDRCLDARGDVA